jgi:branched-chain amino acid transport system substrate-binding protein
VIGWTDVENSLGVNFVPQKNLIKNLVDYLNSTGGIGGHPIKLDTCAQTFTTGGAQCANQFLQDKAVGVTGIGITDGGSMYPILKTGGVPFLGSGVATAADLTADGNHFAITSGALGKYLAVDKYLTQTLHPKTVGVIVGTSASAQQAADNFIKKPLTGTGINIKITSITESNPDYTSTLATLHDANFTYILTTCTQSNAIFKQAQSLGTPLIGLGCTGLTDISTMGAGAKGVYGYNYSVPVDDPRYASRADVKQYLTLAAKYGWDHAENSGEVYGDFLAMVSVIEKAGGATTTGPKVAQALASANGVALPLGVSSTGLNCATPPVSSIATACNATGLMVQVQSDGKVLAVDGSPLTP